MTGKAETAAAAKEARGASPVAALPPPSDNRVRIYLCRHGQTDWNAEKRIQGSVDRSLSAVGLRQAKLVGEALRDVPLDLVGSSSLRRAMETADAIAFANVHAPLTRAAPAAGLDEMCFGEYEGRVVDDISAGHEAVQRLWAARDFTARWPGGESMAEVAARAKKALARILAEAPTDARHVALVTHGRLNKILLAALLPDIGLARSTDLHQHNCCINVIDVRRPPSPGDSNDQLDCVKVLLNSAEHLASLANS